MQYAGLCAKIDSFYYSIKLLPLRYLLLISLFLSLLFEQAIADEDWGLCRTPSFRLVEAPVSDLFATEILSQSMSRDSNNLIHLNGDVQLNRAGQTIRADELIIDTQSEQLEANGGVIFEDINYRLKTETLRLNQKDGTAWFGPTEFKLRLSHASGTADEIEKIDEYRSRYHRILYTTCDPEDKDWHLKASELTIDDESGRGTARHTTIYFQNVPFLYLPYFMFPIDDRRLSGVLTPLLSYSQSSGASFALPVYWNIAPNLDATITPAWYSKRGLQMILEGRYLYENHAGQVDLAYLDDDLVNSSRWFRKWQASATPGLDINADLLLQEVSDDEYFRDFDFLTTENDNIKHLERHLTFSHNSSSWQSSLQWQNYQTIDQTTAIAIRPYERLPRIRLDSQFQPLENGLHFDMRNELVEFDRESSVTGTRLHIVPAVSWSQNNSWYFFEPRLQYALTEYRLDNNNSGENSISRHLPTLSLDTGLIFERLANARHGWIQTLEPRLFFLQTPFEDQTDIPDFDTADLSDSLNNFYRTNRFSGFDRIGDANQITLGLGSRIYREEGGAELMNLTLGQIHYFEDRRVSLDGKIDDTTKSNLIAQFSLTPTPDWKVTSKLVHQPEDHMLSEKNLSIHYAKQGFAANIEYFFTEQVLEQALISAAYPLNNRWTLVAKIHRSIKFDSPVDNLLGMSYESCCWGIKILASQTSDDDFLETENKLYFELTLKGLGKGGDDIDTKLGNSIPGYQAGF